MAATRNRVTSRDTRVNAISGPRHTGHCTYLIDPLNCAFLSRCSYCSVIQHAFRDSRSFKMAIVELPGGVEMYYEVHTARVTSSDLPPNELGLSPSAATIVVLTPIWLDCTYLSDMLDDMSTMYNIVAFELRSHGRTFQPQKNPRYDCATAAADIGESAVQLINSESTQGNVSSNKPCCVPTRSKCSPLVSLLC